MRETVALGAAMLAYLPSAFALNPALDINQYSHTAWKTREGLINGSVMSIAQTPDGYLWLGTDFTVLRFDGVRMVPWQATDQPLPSNAVTKLLVARDGTLWIGSLSGLASWKDGKLTTYAELSGRGVFSLREDHEGAIWVGTPGPAPGMLCSIQNGHVQCVGDDGRFGNNVLSLYEDRKGNLWAGTSAGLWRWKPAPATKYPVPLEMVEISDMIDTADGVLWIATREGIRQVVDGKAELYPFPASGLQFRPRKFLRDREGSLWIGTSASGLWHVHEGRVDVFTSTDGLSGDSIQSLFEDREGNIWVGTNNGLDRFRDVAVPTMSFRQGLPRAIVGATVASKDGSIWIATYDGLSRWNKGQITIYRRRSSPPLLFSSPKTWVREVVDPGFPDNGVQSIFHDSRGRIWVSGASGMAYFERDHFVPVRSLPGGNINSIAEDTQGDFWIANMYLGLIRMSGSMVEQIPWTKLMSKGSGSVLLPDARNGGLWVGSNQGGITYWKDGQVRASHATGAGLGAGWVSSLRLDEEGTLWAATRGGLSRLKDGRWATLTSTNGLPCDSVHWEVEDASNSFWLFMPCGLVRIARAELYAWSAEPGRTIKAMVLDSADGATLRSYAGGYTPLVAKASDGKLWFSTIDAVSIVDPGYLPTNKLPPPVHIEQITADHKPYGRIAGLRLPPLVRDLQIDYAGLTLGAPESVHFRYILEGHDRDWQDAGTRRQAFFNDLPPRKYRFRVSARNKSGVWNEAGASLDFSIDPAYYQTNWFRASCVAAFLAFLGIIYRLRLLYMAQQFNIRLDERVNERTRIARDLHDTLLQSFQGVLLKFHAITYMLGDRSDVKNILEGAIEQARQAIAEGRDAVQGLRSSPAHTEDLARAIGTFGKGLASNPNGRHPPDFRVHVEGTPKDLPPVLRDDIYRIAGEALRNAFRHSGASRVEVELHYDKRRLRLRVRDNGKGIDAKVLGQGGRAGHHGIVGMQERAELLGGKLAVWSEVDSGAEIELTIPAAVAYARPSATDQAASSI